MDLVSRHVLAKLYAGDRAGAEEAAGGNALDVFAAAALGRDEEVRQRLAADPATSTGRTDDGFTALHLAAFFGTSTTVATLLAGGADPASVADNPMRVTPLHSALAKRDVASTRELLEAGAPVDAPQEGGYTALHAAAMHGDAALVRLLLDHGADPGRRDGEGRTAADHAANAGHTALAELLAPPGGLARHPPPPPRPPAASEEQ